MDNEKVCKIKRIVRWITEIEHTNAFLKRIRFSTIDENKVIKTKYIFDHKVKNCLSGNASIEIDNSMMTDFCEFLGEKQKHLEKLIDESDKDLVDIAKEYLKGDFGELIER